MFLFEVFAQINPHRIIMLSIYYLNWTFLKLITATSQSVIVTPILQML